MEASQVHHGRVMAEVTGIYWVDDALNTKAVTFSVETPNGVVECFAYIDKRDIINRVDGHWDAYKGGHKPLE
jgi:hypothetical protein